MSRYQIDIEIETPVSSDLVDSVRRAAWTVLEWAEADSETGLTLLLTGEDRIRQLNRDFMGYDEPTDVLSFPSGEAMPGAEEYLGDIAIAVPVAERQAGNSGHTLGAELQLLVIHGALHLLGYDHSRPEEKEKMWASQADILNQLGADIEYPE